MNALGQPRAVLVLGGTSEIGLATARRLVDRGARRVVLAGRDAAALQQAVEDLAPAAVEIERFDAADPAGHADLLDRVFAGGDVDLAILAFGLLGDQEAIEADPALGVEVAQTNYVGAVSAGLHLAAHFRRQGHGLLVVLSSIAGVRPRRANFTYGSTKAGLDAFAQGLGEALRGSGARVLIVRPGFARTKMTAHLPDAPLATTPDAVADQIVRALARDSAVVWVPPALRLVGLILRVVPRSVLRRLPR